MSLPILPPPPSPHLLALAERAQPVRVRRPIRQLALVIGASVLCGGLLVAGPARWIWGCSLRPDLPVLPRLWVLGGGVVWASAFVVTAVFAVIPARGQVLTRVRPLKILTLIVPLVLSALSLASPIVPGHSFVAQDTATAVSAAAQCLAAAITVALCPISLGLWVLRRAVPAGAGWVAAGLGASGATLGGFFLHLHCPWAAPSHVIPGHVLPIVVGAALTAWLGRRVLEP